MTYSLGPGFSEALAWLSISSHTFLPSHGRFFPDLRNGRVADDAEAIGLAPVYFGCTSLKAITESFGYSAIPNSSGRSNSMWVPQISVEDAASTQHHHLFRKSMNAGCRVTVLPFFRWV